MERKIGGIFEYNGDWLQCIEGSKCTYCYFHFRGECDKVLCMIEERTDVSSVYFKKLEKIGGPYQYMDGIYQEYKPEIYPIISSEYYVDTVKGFAVKIKQNKEDMEDHKMTIDEATRHLLTDINTCHDTFSRQVYDWLLELKKYKEKEISNSGVNLNLKPFSLSEAKQGKPVCTRDGRKARIICFDSNGGRPIVALITESDGEEEFPYKYHYDGSYNCQDIPSDFDLMMLPEKKEGWVNIYKGGLLDTKSYPTKKESFDKASPEGYVDTVKICWEE